MKNYHNYLFISFLLILFSCSDTDTLQKDLPIAINTTTKENLEITYTTIKISGEVKSLDENEIISQGICWSTNPNPTIYDNIITENTNVFSKIISNLTANTTYYFKIYATNINGTAYSEEVPYTTSSLAGTTWDFLLVHDPTNPNEYYGYWHADVTFNEDGTTVYDEPDFSGTYTTYGTWSLDENTLNYDLDSSEDSNTRYQFKGIITKNSMEGTYNFGSENKTWSATKY